MQKREPPGVAKAYRPEIEGLRAVAAVLVAVFHIWLGRVSGGVDVFFVVSGFLITTGLVTQIERHGAPQIAAFWGRLINRLVPAAFLVLCAVVVASIFLLPKSRWQETMTEVAGSAVYVENWILAFNSVDYLQQNAAVSPVQHFWALAAQGQFYLAWPLLFAVIAFAARRAEIHFRHLAGAALLLLFAVSLAFSVWATQRNQAVAYFITPARVWEFCIGGLLAIFLARIAMPVKVRVLAGWVGLLAVLSCGFVLQVSQVFPGYAALWPTLGGALVLAAGTSGSRFGVDRLLGSAPMVYLGGISYAIYLWHFPILAFYRAYTWPEPVSVLAGATILAATGVLAVLTHRLVEAPVKRAKIGSERPWRAYAFGAVCSVPVVVGLVTWNALYRHEHAEEQAVVTNGNPDYPGARALEPGFTFQPDAEAEIQPGPLSAELDFDPRGERCGQPYESVVPVDCTIVGEPGMPTIAVVGGSHSLQWLPVLEEVASRARWRIVSYTRSACPFYFGEDEMTPREWRECPEWNRNVLARLERLRPDAVFMTSTRYARGVGEQLPEGYLAAWRALGEAGIKVIAVRDNPNFQIEASDCVELHGADAPACALDRLSAIANPSPVDLLATRPSNVRFIDLTNFFCTTTACPPVVGNVLVYRDHNHFTATYGRTLAPMLGNELRAVLDVPASGG
jgi:peptidoglycan/LPS O-acetylase OafA/YrhL